MPTDGSVAERGPAIPLSRWANRQLQHLAGLTASSAIAALNGMTLLGERATSGGFVITSRISPGPGGSRLLPTRDGGWLALTLPRIEDRELLPALFGNDGFDIADDSALAAQVARFTCAQLLRQGRSLGLAVACADERPLAAPLSTLSRGPARSLPPPRRPLVVDLSATWAGPLAAHLLWLGGARVVKVESRNRPDRMRHGDPALFTLLNQGKASAAIDLRDQAEREALVDLIRRADVVIESSRPRALLQFGIDADQLVRQVPGLVWLSITGHGATGEAADWIGFGNDCAVAGGLSSAFQRASGRMGFVGDAIADPLAGITTALAGWRALQKGEALRIGVAMSANVAQALAEERKHDAARLDAELRDWADSTGRPYPVVPRRHIAASVRPLGADTHEHLLKTAPC